MNKVLLLLATMMVAMLAPAGSALGATSFVRVGAFNEASPDGQPAHQHRIAVNQATGDVYVTDPINDRIGVSTPNGTGADPLTSFGSGVLTDPYGIAIDQSTGDVYVSDSDDIVKFTSDGAATPTFTQDNTFADPAVTGPLAFDQVNHQLLVADTATNHVRRYSTAGAVVSDFDGTAGTNAPGAFTGLQDLAVDSSGDIVIVDATGNPARNDGSVSRVERYTATGDWQTIGPVEQAATVAIHPGDDNVIVSGNQNTVYSSGNPTLHVFAPDGSSLGELDTDAALPYATVSGIAADDGPSGRLSVATDNGDFNNGLDQYNYGYTSVQVYAPIVVPAVTTGAAASVASASATLHGTVDPDGVDATYHFEYGIDTTYGSSTAESAPLTGTGAQAASSDLTGLHPATTYHYRLVATNANATRRGEDATLTTALGAPTIEATSASATATEAEIGVTINPNGAITTYHVEYGTTAAYGTSTHDMKITAGNRPVEGTVHLDGLTPGTRYHYRVVAANSGGEVTGADQDFTTPARSEGSDSCANAAVRAAQRSSFLPDCRAYEMVSPVDKNGGDLGHGHGTVRINPAGDAATFDSQVTFGDAKGSGAGSSNTYVARRTALGWTTHGVTPNQAVNPASIFYGAVVWAFSPDLDKLIVRASDPPLTADAPEDNSSLYVGDSTTDTFRLLTKSVHPMPASPVFGVADAPWFGGASADFRHIVFESNKDLTPDTSGDCNLLLAGCPMKTYEWIDGEVRLVGIAPNGTPLPGGASAGDGAVRGGESDSFISDDGRRVFFTSPGVPSGMAYGDVYVRNDGAATVQLNASERTQCADQHPCDPSVAAPDPAGPQPALFEGANDSGSVAFLSTPERLTDDDTDALNDLYAYNTALPSSDPHNLTLVSADHEPSDNPTAVLGLIGVSQSGDHAYFTSSDKLMPGEPQDVGASYTIYEWSAASNTLRFVGLSGIPSTHGSTSRDSIYQIRPYVSRDGSRLLFGSAVQQGGSPDPDGHNQVYLFDASDGGLTCLSCRPDGRASTGEVHNSLFQLGAGQYSYSNRSVLDDGSVAFFDTTEPLVPEDVNSARDVYEWRDGKARLISPGTDGSESSFADVTAGGENVMFLTSQRLVGGDHDASVDLYDARVGGGFAEPAGRVPCEGDGCQGAAASPPSIPDAGSVDFVGAGNVEGRPTSPAATQPKVVVAQLKAVTGTTAKLRVRVPSAGAVSVSGSAVRRSTRTAAKAGTVTVTVALTAKAKQSLRKHRSLKVKLTVLFKPRAGRSVSKTASVTFKQPKTKAAKNRSGSRIAARADAKGGR